MIKPYCNFFKGAGLLAFLLVFLQHNAKAQATHRVTNADANSLETFIETGAWAAGDIIMLTSEGVYDVTGIVDMPRSLTLMGDPTLATRPIIHFTTSDNGLRAMTNEMNITIKGIDFNGLRADGGRASAIYRADAAVERINGLVLENSKAWGFASGIELSPTNYKGRYESVLINKVQWDDFAGSTYPINLRLGAVKNFRVANSTFSNLQLGFISPPYFSNENRPTKVEQDYLIENSTFYKVAGISNGSLIQFNDPLDQSIKLTFRNNIVSMLFAPELARPFRINPMAGRPVAEGVKPIQIVNNVFHDYNSSYVSGSTTFNISSLQNRADVNVSDPVITTDPGFADPEKGDFTLAAGSPAIAVGGDPQWLPAVEAREHLISSTEENALKTFIENTELWNPGDIIRLSGNYTEKGYINIKQDITIIGENEDETRPLITFHGGGFRPAVDGLSITMKGFDINGKTMDAENKEVRAMIIEYGRDNAFGAELIHIENMNAYGLSNGVELYFNQGQTYDKIIINNVVWHDITNWVFNPRINALLDTKITNSTFYNAGGFMFNPYFTNNNRPQVIQQTVLVEHNTFYDIVNTNKALLQLNDSRDGSMNLTFRNNIVSTLKDPGNSRPFLLHAEAGTFTLSNNVIHNFEATDEGKKQYNYVEIGKLPNVTDTPPITVDPGFANAVEGDFTLPVGTALLTAGTDGGLVGDPRWNPGNVTSTEPELAAAKIEVYPNPVRDMLYINSPAAVEVIIYNISGSVVMKGSVNRVGSINIASLKSGLYIARIDSGNKVQSVKLIKE